MTELRMLGTSKLHVSPIGIGMAALGRPGYINLGHADDLAGNTDLSAMESHAHAILDAAYDRGVRYFDAARSYGEAEAFLGSWLRSRQFSPADITVGSKWGYAYTANWQIDAESHEVKEHSLAQLQRQWQETQECLGEYLDLYQIHSATLKSGVLDNNDVLAELARLKQENGIAIGLTTSGDRQGETLDRACSITVDNKPLFDCVQVTWNLLERSARPAIAKASAAGMGVIVKEALANGRLTPRNTNPAFAEKRSQLEAEARRLNTTIDALALAAVLAQPWADVVLSGAATVEHLHSNWQAIAVGWDELAATHLESLSESATEYWQTRSSLQWN